MKRNLYRDETRTIKTAKAISEELAKYGIEISPDKLRYTIGSYLGGPGTQISSAINFTGKEGQHLSEIPGLGAITRRASTERDEVNTPEWRQANATLTEAKGAKERKHEEIKRFFYDKQDPKTWISIGQQLAPTIPANSVLRTPEGGKYLLKLMKDKIKNRGDIDYLVGQFSVDDGARAQYYLSRQEDFKDQNSYLKYLEGEIGKKLIDKKTFQFIQHGLANPPATPE
jgi:hypothetical protein